MLVGRAPELARIDEVLQHARCGRAGALVLVGEPGVGKSALLEHARARADGMLVVSARGLESESELPYAGLLQLASPLLERLDALPAHQRDALAGALGLAPPHAAHRFAVYVATLGLLALAAEDRPLLVLVDDAQWLDRPSFEGVAFCARRALGEDMAVLFATRADEAGAAPGIGLPELRIGGLGLDASEALLRDRAGLVARDVVAQLHGATRGNPLALAELAALLQPEQLSGAEPLPEPLPLGPDVERAFGRRLAGLRPATRQALLLAAASSAGDARELAAALAACGLDLGALAPAERSGVVAITNGRVEFTHPLWRSAAYYRASAPDRRQAHCVLAAVLRAPCDRGRRAWHLSAATVVPDEAVAAELEAAALDARARAAPATAGRALEAAARLTPSAAERRRRRLEAAHDFRLAGAPDPALRVLGAALEEAADPVERAEIQHARARIELKRSSPPRVRNLLLEEAALAEPHDEQRATAMLLDAALASAMAGEPRTMIELAERAYPRAVRAGPPLAWFGACLLGTARILRGDAPAGYPLLREAMPILESGDPSLWGALGPPLAQALLWTEHHAEARAVSARVAAGARAAGALTVLPFALVSQAQADWLLGSWPAAAAAATEALSLAEQTGQESETSNPLVVLALIEGGQGDALAARDHLARALDIASRFGVHSITAVGTWVLGFVELAHGRYDEAIDSLERSRRICLARGLEEPAVTPWAADLAEAYARRRRREDADSTLHTLERQGSGAGRRLALAAAARCRGLLASEHDFDVHFRRAVSLHEAVPVPFERARTELCFGERLRRARRRAEARSRLRAALETFDALGAAPWADRARRELAATGERARRRTSATVDDLTPQELQVALLVAEGATNREAAAALFVSPKTIESHLRTVYRKLGLRSRVELARRVSASNGLA